MIYFIDSNVFLRLLIIDNKKQYNDCFSFIEAIKQNKFDAITNTLVLAEIVWTLLSFYKIPKEKVIEGIKGIVQLRGLKIIDSYNQLLALKLYEIYSIKYIDSLIASSEGISNKKICIVSYDTDFDKLRLLRKEPGQVTS
ncbi:hypothetical protein A3D78_02325 [Candidatus Gottesmanbacteria bacterium RIFCSPHIGHO2_02_FULL_39_14]|uniref:PIN domain-containing protein n=3 Tax=Candidatus Gottesmaniibacteriota TaxID=1752720 RepID=A0A1F6A2D3_9BACT|nr:MAG: hypothetical protein A2153_01655 [Candidatus Gottesmanbacteria bacterium RBG_16_38_7b]OGG18828.1 MAG: hypothetical protein A3D78_02325 [Candidatus Gottesmanbacteria bacterium RIFCSPHIGHO2_02_FULL_39_14]OGG31163.1 MAG: hypothetical protein A3I51_00485 [Candidatus Gottesmanbacteria bacterium RIFCSPLOWO2_02_FULL_38_8]